MTKCHLCSKSIKVVEEIIGKCKCKEIFCGKHRIPESHNCQYKHFESNKKDIEKNNIKITTNKIIVI